MAKRNNMPKRWNRRLLPALLLCLACACTNRPKDVLDMRDMTDVLVTGPLPRNTYYFHADKIDSRNTHGTGCTLSSAIASHLARGENMHDAVEKGKQFLTNALASGKDVAIGKGHGPLNHFFAPEKLIIK